MSGNLNSILALHSSTSKYFTAPETKPAHFKCGDGKIHDIICPHCGSHLDRSLKKNKNCPFCFNDLGIKRGRPCKK